MKVIRNGECLIVVLDNGTVLQNAHSTKELAEQVLKATTEQEVINIMLPKYQEVIKERDKVTSLLDRVQKSTILTLKGSSIYWLEVSELSMPQDFVEKILNAEDSNNFDALEAYKNFWTLLCLNPDSRCRENLFWYLNTWGMKISKAGLFIGYRNVDIKTKASPKYNKKFAEFVVNSYNTIRNRKKSTKDYFITDKGIHDYELVKESNLSDNGIYTDIWNLKEIYNELKATNFKIENIDSDDIYTDHHSHTFTIKLGEMVTMPREKCDTDHDHQCSSGLHLANAEWLTEGYYGEQGLVCVCNPKDVVAVPMDSTYGKLRTCAYLPIALCDYENGKVVPYNVEDGFESKHIKTILYDGIMNTEDDAKYKIEVPSLMPEINNTRITEAILNIARKYMK